MQLLPGEDLQNVSKYFFCLNPISFWSSPIGKIVFVYERALLAFIDFCYSGLCTDSNCESENYFLA